MKKNIAGFEVELTRKKIKNIYLRVLPDGSITISAPKRVSESVIEKFVKSKAQWIAARQSEENKRIVREYKDGESIYLFGERLALVVLQSAKNSIHSEEGKLILYVKENADREKLVNEWYRGVLKERISQRLYEWESITGLKSSCWQIRNMKTRWGTCNVSTRKIWLNLQLAKLPYECLEYVILHELAHLKVSNHGPQFCAILDEYMPHWRDIRKRMNNEYKFML